MADIDVAILARELAAHSAGHGHGPLFEISETDLARLVALASKSVETSPQYPIPGPYEIALRVGASLAASGQYQTAGAALQAAWAAVPEFYIGRDHYLQNIAPALYGILAQGGEDAGETRHN